jgi:hypothetical protein
MTCKDVICQERYLPPPLEQLCYPRQEVYTRVTQKIIKVLQAHVNGIWKQHPGWTAQRIISKLGLEYSVGIVRSRSASDITRIALSRLASADSLGEGAWAS